MKLLFNLISGTMTWNQFKMELSNISDFVPSTRVDISYTLTVGAKTTMAKINEKLFNYFDSNARRKFTKV